MHFVFESSLAALVSSEPSWSRETETMRTVGGGEEMLPQEEGEMGRGRDAGHWEPAAKYDEDTGHWTRKHTAVAKYNWCHLQLVPGIGGVIAVPPSHGDHCRWRLETGPRERAVSPLRRCVRMCGQFLCLLSAVN